MNPEETEKACNIVLPLLGEDEQTISKALTGENEKMLRSLLEKISLVAEKIQKNTSRMIADGQFLSQMQVADTVLTLCDDATAATLNGKVIPGDRVFYPVRSHVGAGTPQSPKPDLAGKCVFMTADASNSTDAERVISMASHVESCGGKAVCITAKGMDASLASSISDKVHSHEADITDQEQVSRWMNTHPLKLLSHFVAVLHFTGQNRILPAFGIVDLLSYARCFFVSFQQQEISSLEDCAAFFHFLL